jgi:FdhD protein
MSVNENQALVLQGPALRLARVIGAPLLSNATSELLREIPCLDHEGVHHSIQIPVERPLTVCVDDKAFVTLMTIGSAPEWLVAGYLRNQQLVDDVTHLESIIVDWALGTASVIRRQDERGVDFGTHPLGGAGFGAPAVLANFMATARAFAHTDAPRARISTDTIRVILASLRQRDSVFRVAGTVHGCALFQGSHLWIGAEDVSRRNAIDIVCGWMALHGVAGADKILFTTGRLTAETVMKAALSRIPILVSRKGITGMAYDLGTSLGMILIGRATGHSYVCFAGADFLAVDV